jgi:hypothetical protein
LRKQDEKFITAGGTYVDDIMPPDDPMLPAAMALT